MESEANDKEILFYALRQLEQEIIEAKAKQQHDLLNYLETKYSYWKQLMAN